MAAAEVFHQGKLYEDEQQFVNAATAEQASVRQKVKQKQIKRQQNREVLVFGRGNEIVSQPALEQVDDDVGQGHDQKSENRAAAVEIKHNQDAEKSQHEKGTMQQVKRVNGHGLKAIKGQQRNHEDKCREGGVFQ